MYPLSPEHNRKAMAPMALWALVCSDRNNSLRFFQYESPEKWLKSNFRDTDDAWLALASHVGRILVHTQFVQLQLGVSNLMDDHDFCLRNKDGYLIVFVKEACWVMGSKRCGIISINVLATSLSMEEDIKRRAPKQKVPYIHDYERTHRMCAPAIHVNVLLVETDKGTSKRIGIGKAYLISWIKAKPELVLLF